MLPKLLNSGLAKMSDNKSTPPMSKLDSAAILLMSLGEGDAAAILKHMGPKEVQRVGAAM
ncbi:MAG: flagellar motor switch protein FliG, partial [Pseudomonadota bacterium]